MHTEKTELDLLLDHYGPDLPVRYVVHAWGPEPFADRLGTVLAEALDQRPDRLDGLTVRLDATDAGEGILYDADGAAILLLATEDDLDAE